MAQQNRLLGEPLGARGAHIVLADLVEEEGPVQARVGRQGHEHHHQHRQRRIDGQIGPEAVGPALHRKPAEAKREHILADDHIDQQRDRHRHRGDHHHDAVGQAAAHIGHAHRHRNREQHLHQQDRQHDRQGGRQTAGEQMRHRLVGGPALAPVEGHDLPDEDPELLPYRLVQAELLADRIDLLGRSVQAAEDFSRVAAKVLEEKEHQQHDTEQGRNHLPQASYQVCRHCCRFSTECGYRFFPD